MTRKPPHSLIFLAPVDGHIRSTVGQAGALPAALSLRLRTRPRSENPLRFGWRAVTGTTFAAPVSLRRPTARGPSSDTSGSPASFGRDSYVLPCLRPCRPDPSLDTLSLVRVICRHSLGRPKGTERCQANHHLEQMREPSRWSELRWSSESAGSRAPLLDYGSIWAGLLRGRIPRIASAVLMVSPFVAGLLLALM